MKTTIHILRNPHGWCEESVRIARLDAADRLESALQRIEQLEATQRELVEALEKLLSVTRHLEPCAGTVDEVEVVLNKVRNQSSSAAVHADPP